MASEASFSERAAMEAEREVVDIYRAYFMRDRIGDVFEGTISGVMGFGIFVVIDQPFIEGLVRVEALSDDYYLFDEVTARLVGRRTGRTFALGDTVKVEVQSVSVVRRKVDFALAGHRARHHDSRGERFGRKGERRDKGARREKRGRREEKPDRGRPDRAHGTGRPDKRRASLPSGGKPGGARPGGNRRRAKPKKRR
jgi:ribonuclease R